MLNGCCHLINYKKIVFENVSSRLHTLVKGHWGVTGIHDLQGNLV